MSPVKNPAIIGLVLGAALCVPAVCVVACSNSNGNPAPPVYGNDGSSDATPNVGDGSQSNPDSSPEGSPNPGPDGQGPVDSAGAAADADAGTSAPDCASALTAAGCWTCPSASDGSVEFLNQCSGTGVKCVAFDPSRLPGIDAGRPPLN
jgi:hypothetical protein